MNFKFTPREYQTRAVDSVIKIFKGQPTSAKKLDISHSSILEDIYGNSLVIGDDIILNNLQSIQRENSRKAAPIDIAKDLIDRDFAIEMETGTGKTLVYLETIATLAKEYKWNKFIIVVPSIPIKEGTESEFKRLKSHLENIAETAVNMTVYDSNKINSLADYHRSQMVEILLMTMGSFNKDINVLNRENPDSTFGRPVDLLADLNPIIILDEPQKMLGEATTNKLKNFNPLFTLRYSATHKIDDNSTFKFIFRYTPLDAYRDKYVKKIEVLSVYDSSRNPIKAYVAVNQINSTKNLTAKITHFVDTIEGIKEKNKTVSIGYDIFRESNGMPEYKDFIITRISSSNGIVQFRNGIEIKENEVSQNKDDVMKIQIRETIRTHLDKEKRLNSKGIKVLSLFFIDKVINYRDSDDPDGKGKIRKWFEEAYNEITFEEGYEDFIVKDIDKVQLAYFSVDKKGLFKDSKEGAQTEADYSVYDKIMNQKELLVSFAEPARFIFSHSALREGWDNPNVFQICSLNETKNEVKRRQEVGRGLRLPVDQEGNRIINDDINILTIASNVSYELFAKALQQEITADTGIKTSEAFISNAVKRRSVPINRSSFENEEFKKLWKVINKKLSYSINVDEDILINTLVKRIKKSNFRIDPISYKKQKVLMKDIYDATKNKQVNESTDLQTIKITRIPNVIKRIADYTGLTKKVVIKVISATEIMEYIFIQPDIFVEKLCMIIKDELPNILKNGIVYQASGEYYEQTLFNDYIQVYEGSENPLVASGLDIDRTFYNLVQLDSESEVKLIEEMNADKNRFKFFVKLPANFKVPTPAGNYNPDWALVFEENNNPEVYLVRETKKTNGRFFSKEKLRQEETRKIEYGKKAFDSINVDYQVIQTVDDIEPNNGVFDFENIDDNFEKEKNVQNEEFIEKATELKAHGFSYGEVVKFLSKFFDEILSEEQFNIL